MPFQVTTGAPLLDRKRNIYLRKETLEVHLIKRTEEVDSERATHATTRCDGPPHSQTSPKTPDFRRGNLCHGNQRRTSRCRKRYIRLGRRLTRPVARTARVTETQCVVGGVSSEERLSDSEDRVPTH